LLLVGLTVLLLALSGCGGGGGGGEDPGPPGPAAVISVQPVSQAAISGGSVTLSVTAAGSGLSYQWQRSTDAGATWADVAGATAASTTITGLSAAMNGWLYRVAIASTSGGTTVLSSAVTLTVTTATAPAIAVQPADVQVLVGGEARFSVTASGTSVAYQWQRSSDGSTWADIGGATAASLVLSAVTADDNGRRLRVVLSNSVGTVTSAAVLLTVNPVPAAPVITTQPASANVTAPAAATFVVVASGTPAPTCQWQQSLNSGAAWASLTGGNTCSFTTPATTLSDSGTQFRVVVSNSAGSVTSAVVTLTVTAAAVAPSITTQPQNQTVSVPAVATFTVAAAGTPTPTFQWQLSTDGGSTFVNINGATAASYATPATMAADNGKRFRVVVSSTAGTLNSAAALLTVNATAVSPLSGRTWQTGQRLVADTGPYAYNSPVKAAVIDDSGAVTLVVAKNDGTRDVLVALRGAPNAAGTAPSWAAAVTLGPVGSGTLGGAATAVVAPGGDVGVLWNETVACDASVPLPAPPPSTCIATYVRRYRAATASWEAPTLVNGMAPYTPYQAMGNSGELSINDRGDMLVRGSGWVANGTNSITLKDTLFMRTAVETAFRQQVFEDPKLYGWALQMDNQGALLAGAQYRQNGTTDIVAFRGTVASGLDPTPTVLDTRASEAQLQAMAIGLNGQQVIMWAQNNGARDTWYSAIAGSASGAFAVLDMGASFTTTFSNLGLLNPARRLFVTDSGDVLLYDLSSPSRIRWTAAAGWGAVQSMPESVTGRFGFNRRGDYLRVVVDDPVGNTKAYDGGRNVLLPAPGYVLGTATQANNSNPYFYLYGLGYGTPLLSVSGVGFTSINWYFDVLPTPALPAGDGRNAMGNLWGVFLK
jgi:hypothetical protein